MRSIHCSQRAAEHGMVAALAAAVGGDLLVGEHGAERGAPVHRRLVEVREAVGVDDRASRVGVELAPRAHSSRLASLLGFPGARPRTRHEQLGDRTGAVGVLVVPGVEELQEDPLRPPVVVDVGGGDAPARVVPEAQRPELAAHVGDVRLGRGPRMLAGLHRVLLGRKPEGVVAHRVQHVVAAHAHVAREHVGADVAERVPDVEACATRVREHVEHVELAPARDRREAVGQRTGRVGRAERVVGLPPVLPLRFDLVRQRGVVAIARDVGRSGRRVRHRCGERTGPRSRDPRWYRVPPSGL